MENSFPKLILLKMQHIRSHFNLFHFNLDFLSNNTFHLAVNGLYFPFHPVFAQGVLGGGPHFAIGKCRIDSPVQWLEIVTSHNGP